MAAECAVLKEGTKLSNNDIYTSYAVIFEKKFVRGVDITEYPPVRSIELVVYARDIDEAIKQAWQTVTVTPEKYEITSINIEKYGRRNGTF